MEATTKAQVMLPESMEAFVASEKSRGASEDAVRRLRTATKSLYEFLPEDKELTRKRLLAWRDDMNAKGYAYRTVQNYAKAINLYLDFIGLSDIRFNRGKGKDIAGLEFGFITALEPTEKRVRRDVVWRCRCRCGSELELPATRLLLNNTLSCGCIQKEHIKRAKKYFGGTSLEQSLQDTVVSTRSTSGYVGVTRKKGKWQAYITYKKQHYSLGTYTKLEDAIKARARAKEAVMEDAAKLLEVYQELHQNDSPLPGKSVSPKIDVVPEVRVVNNQPVSAAKRSDNTSGHTGISFSKNRWEARICYCKRRYMLGRFETREEAIAEREKAESLLKSDPDGFVKYYSKNKKSHMI